MKKTPIGTFLIAVMCGGLAKAQTSSNNPKYDCSLVEARLKTVVPDWLRDHPTIDPESVTLECFAKELEILRYQEYSFKRFYLIGEGDTVSDIQTAFKTVGAVMGGDGWTVSGGDYGPDHMGLRTKILSSTKIWAQLINADGTYGVLLYETNCGSGQFRMLQISTYKSDGASEGTKNPPSDWEYPIPGSAGEEVFNVACKPKSK